MRIEIVVLDGFDDLDAFAPNEVLHHAAARRPDWHVRLVGVDGPARAMLLAGAGLTTGRPAVTHHAALDELAATGALGAAREDVRSCSS